MHLSILTSLTVSVTAAVVTSILKILPSPLFIEDRTVNVLVSEKVEAVDIVFLNADHMLLGHLFSQK
jgi:hypothetical protein